MSNKSAAKYMWKSEEFINKWVKRYLEVGSADDLLERALDRAITVKEDTDLFVYEQFKY